MEGVNSDRRIAAIMILVMVTIMFFVFLLATVSAIATEIANDGCHPHSD